jgi:hypothetical protein
MALPHSTDSDPALDKVLREWQVGETLPPRFREQVWQRIAREEAEAPGSLWTLVLRKMAGALLRPSLAVSCVAVLVLGGLLAGYWHARVDNARTAESLGARYVQLVDAYQAPHR